MPPTEREMTQQGAKAETPPSPGKPKVFRDLYTIRIPTQDKEGRAEEVLDLIRNRIKQSFPQLAMHSLPGSLGILFALSSTQECPIDAEDPAWADAGIRCSKTRCKEA